MNTQLAKLFQDTNIDAVLLWHPSEIFCFTKYITDSISANAAVIFPDKTVIIAPEGAAKAQGITVLEYAVYGYDKIANPAASIQSLLCEQLRGIKRLGISLTPAVSLPFNSCNANTVDITKSLRQIMTQKPADFLHLFKAASELNHRAYESIRKNAKAGISEFALRAIVEASYNKSAGHLLLCGGDYVSGPRTQGITSPPSDRLLQAGDSVIVDIQATLVGAGVDDCRTFFVDKPDKNKSEAYAAVLKALQDGADCLIPGADAASIYNAVSRSLKSSGYADLPHHAGHGLGYSWYEAPYFIPTSDEILKPGMLVTLEPAVYVDGFGIRVENNYLLTEHGCKQITSTPSDIEWATLY